MYYIWIGDTQIAGPFKTAEEASKVMNDRQIGNYVGTACLFHDDQPNHGCVKCGYDRD